MRLHPVIVSRKIEEKGNLINIHIYWNRECFNIHISHLSPLSIT